jgi:uncharacterized membrane protein YccC
VSRPPSFGPWRRLADPGLARSAFAAAAARQVELRHAVRVSVAVGAAFAISALLHLPQGYWSVFTAVIVVQTSIGGTLQATRDRLIGTIVGGLVGALATYLKANTLLQEGVVLSLTIAVLAFGAAVKPSLKVAPITAAIVLIGQTKGMPPLEAAAWRVAEIVIGSIIGLAATLLVFPARAHGSVLDQAAGLMVQVAELLDLYRRRLAGESVLEEVDAAHAAIRRALASLETVMAEAKREASSRLSPLMAPEALPRTIWRVRNDTVTVERALSRPLPAAVAEKLGQAAMDMLAAERDSLTGFAAAVSAGKASDRTELDAAHAAFQKGVEAFRAAGLTRALGFDTAARVFGLIFALENLYGNLRDLADRVDELSAVQARAPWALPGWS